MREFGPRCDAFVGGGEGSHGDGSLEILLSSEVEIRLLRPVDESGAENGKFLESWCVEEIGVRSAAQVNL